MNPMPTTSAVIGEGMYGCIHKPSLTCKENKIKNYKNKVSKILEKKYADIELQEYAAIENVDKSHMYYLGKPEECSLDRIPSNLSSIEKCKMGKELLKHLDELSLLIMDDGGIDLKVCSNIMSTWNASLDNVKAAEYFMLDFHNIFCGIDAFLKQNILHFDMKPQNIVYNAAKRKMNIIDFGLSVSLKEKLEDIEHDKNTMARYHWSYPFEFYFLNKTTYKEFAEMTNPNKYNYYKGIIRELLNDDMSTMTNSMKTFFSFVLDKDIYTQEFKDYMSGVYQTLMLELTMKNYKPFIAKSIRSVDVYGLGITLLYILKNAKHLLNENLHKELLELGYNMIHPQLSKRISTNTALVNYETILTKNGLMDKYGLFFANHKIMKGELIPPKIEESIDSVQMKNVILDDTKLEKNTVSVHVVEKSLSLLSPKSISAKKMKKKQKKRKLVSRKKQKKRKPFSRKKQKKRKPVSRKNENKVQNIIESYS